MTLEYNRCLLSGLLKSGLSGLSGHMTAVCWLSKSRCALVEVYKNTAVDKCVEEDFSSGDLMGRFKVNKVNKHLASSCMKRHCSSKDREISQKSSGLHGVSNCFEMTIKCSSNITLISLPLTEDVTTVKIPTWFLCNDSLTFQNTFHFYFSPLYQSH